MTQAVTELVVDGSGALSILGQYEEGMERAGQATQQSTGAVDRFNAAMAKFAATQEKGLAITTQSVSRRTAEQRAMERWQSSVNKNMRLEIQLRREAERAAVDMANAVALGYTTQERALMTLIALEQKHAAQIRETATARSSGAFNTSNLAAQGFDVAATAAFMPWWTVALQQGPQVAQVFNDIRASGEKIGPAVAGAFLQLVNPVSLVTVGVIAAGAALVQYFASADEELASLDDAMSEHARTVNALRESYGGAAASADEFGHRSSIALEAAERRARATLEAMAAVASQEFVSNIQHGGWTLFDLIAPDELNAIRLEFAAFAEPIAQLRREIAAGNPDFAAFEQRLQAIANTDPSNLQSAADEILGLVDPAAQAYAQLENASGALRDLSSIDPDTSRAKQRILDIADAADLTMVRLRDLYVVGSTITNMLEGMEALARGVAPKGDAIGGQGSMERAQEQFRELLDLELRWGELRDHLGNTTLPDKPKRQRKTDEERAAERYDKLIRSAHEFIAAQELEQQALFMTEEAAAALRYEQELLNWAANDNIDLTEMAADGERTRGDVLRDLAASMAEAEAETWRMREATDFARDVTRGFFDDFRSGLESGKGLWESFADAALGALDKIVDKMLDDVLDAIFQVNNAGAGGGGWLDWLLKGFGGLIGGGSGNSSAIPWSEDIFRARGGPVAAGTPYIVGERRPELFIPNQSGTILPYVPALPRMQAPANGNGTVVQIIDQRRGGTISEERDIGPNGEERVRLIVRDEVEQYDKTLPDRVAAINAQPRMR